MECAKGLEETATNPHTHTALAPLLQQSVEETVASEEAGILVNRQHRQCTPRYHAGRRGIWRLRVTATNDSARAMRLLFIHDRPYPAYRLPVKKTG